MKIRGSLLFCASAAYAVVSSTFAASPTEQIRSASKLPELSLEALKRGEIIGVRGPLGDYTRGVYVENCYFVRAPAEKVGEKLLHWDTTKHPEFDVSILREYRWPAPPDVFDSLALRSARKEERWLIDQTLQVSSSADPGQLHITANEAAAARAFANVTRDQRDLKVSEFWRKILAARDHAVSTGGLKALPSFSRSDIQIATEFKGLMTLAPSIARHFEPLLNTKPFKESGPTPDEIAPYWQQSKMRGHTNLQLGFLSARKAESWQMADCTYYTSDTYFMSITLYQLFPVENGTLVWQIAFVSAPFRSYLGGTDRFFAGTQMVKEAAETIRLFRGDVER